MHWCCHGGVPNLKKCVWSRGHLTLPGDLTFACMGQNFGAMCAMNVKIVVPNLTTLRGRLYAIWKKNSRGGRISATPPVVALVNFTPLFLSCAYTVPFISNAYLFPNPAYSTSYYCQLFAMSIFVICVVVDGGSVIW